MRRGVGLRRGDWESSAKLIAYLWWDHGVRGPPVGRGWRNGPRTGVVAEDLTRGHLDAGERMVGMV